MRLSILTLATFCAAFLHSAAWAGPVNVNTADAQTLSSELQGIGEAKAAAIVAYREANGPFRRADDLMNVTGFGARTLEMNRDNIRIESVQQPAQR